MIAQNVAGNTRVGAHHFVSNSQRSTRRRASEVRCAIEMELVLFPLNWIHSILFHQSSSIFNLLSKGIFFNLVQFDAEGHLLESMDV